jgi:queuine tRNA-ribosyltransferase
MTTEDSAPPTALSFELMTTDGRARRGRVTTPHGVLNTPAFMPVGTRGTVKGLMPRDLAETGAEICLANTYHLHVAPGDEVVKKLGGLHKMMAWDKPILTDSGGFQVFSLPKLKMDEEGVSFEYKKSGTPIKLTPERSMQIQNNLGADIIMAFDVCVPFPSEYQPAQEAVYRTRRWLERCKAAHMREDQALFGIVQGSTFPDLRALSAQLTAEVELPGYAIGGVSVGEGHQLMMEVVDATEPLMPVHKPRYLMGVGYPEDLVEAVARGIDMFDCVLPSRYGRSGVLFTRRGRIRITKGKYKKDNYPIDTNCLCYACQNFSRGYINHLLNSREILGSTLGTLHNITFYQDLMRAMRLAIEEGTFESFRRAFLDEYLPSDKKEDLNLHFNPADITRDDLSWDTEESTVPNKDDLKKSARKKSKGRPAANTRASANEADNAKKSARASRPDTKPTPAKKRGRSRGNNNKFKK